MNKVKGNNMSKKNIINKKKQGINGKVTHKKSKKNQKYQNKQKTQSGGDEPTQEMKMSMNQNKQARLQELNEKSQATMSATDYNSYAKEMNNLLKQSPDPRYKLDYEYMFSPLLTEQMQRDANAVKGKFFVGVNLMKLYGHLKDIFKKDKMANTEEDTFKSLGDWVNQHKNYEKILVDTMGLRNDTDLVLKPEAELRNNATFREVVLTSKKYSGIRQMGKVTPYGLLKLIRILDKYKNNENQWLRVATVLEIIYKYLSKGKPREFFFRNTNSIPLNILFELEEFYSTEHMFLSKREINEFKEGLEFYRYRKTEAEIEEEKKQ